MQSYDAQLRNEGAVRMQKTDCAKRGVPRVEVIAAGKDNEYSRLSHSGGVCFEHLAFIDSIRNNRTPLTDTTAAECSTLVGLAAGESARNRSAPVTNRAATAGAPTNVTVLLDRAT